jgi:hypothetical protein
MEGLGYRDKVFLFLFLSKEKKIKGKPKEKKEKVTSSAGGICSFFEYMSVNMDIPL